MPNLLKYPRGRPQTWQRLYILVGITGFLPAFLSSRYFFFLRSHLITRDVLAISRETIRIIETIRIMRTIGPLHGHAIRQAGGQVIKILVGQWFRQRLF